MINVPDECFLQVGIGGADNIVNNTTSFELEIIERIGNTLPTALLTMAVDPNEIMSYLATEHAMVYISLGYHEDTATYSAWQIVEFEEYDDKIIFILTLDRSYINDTAFKAYDDQSCNVIKKVVQNYFNIKDANGKSTIKLTVTNDKMTWIQHGNSMRDFVNEVWLHSWGDNKLMMPVISAFIPFPDIKDKSKKLDNMKGSFKLIDMTDTAKAIEIAKHAKTMEEIVKDGKVWMVGAGVYKSASGVYNTNIGNRAYARFDVDIAETMLEEIKPKPIFKGDFNVLNIKTHNDPINSISDNVHKNFAKAKASNLSRLSKFSGNIKKIVVVDYGKITIGDMAMVTIPVHGTTAPNDIQSGKYIVSEIKHIVKSQGIVKTYVKELTLRRDANLVLEHEKLVKGE